MIHFSGVVETRSNEIGNLFDFDKTFLEIELIKFHNDSILKMTSDF